MLGPMVLAMLAAGGPAAGLHASPEQADTISAPGVSEALAQARARRIRSVRYDLVLDVTAPDSANGRVVVWFAMAGEPVDVILDFRGRSLTRLSANGRDQRRVEWDGSHVRVPGRLLRRGDNRVDMEFTAPIAAAGASIIRVRDATDGATYLYTLLVPSDAQQLFPCFDQPDLKARTTLTLVTPPGWTAVANGARLKADPTSRGVVHSFRETEPISTYLIAFAAGPFAEFRAAASARPITLYARKSRAREIEADSIILANDRAVDWLESYFGSVFPFHKLDLVLAPAFPFGGMEHPGAIFYSEERFVFRERPTLPQRSGRTSTIYHEVAHQWFGDLVTMAWFDDLWLKEGFATYLAAKMQDSLDPASESWKTFFLRNKPAAYAVDASEGTTPVWQRVANLDQAKSNYGAIVYNKAPGVLKQLNALVGDQAFRSGVQLFLRRHAWGNATWRDLLSAIGEASGRPLTAWGNAYILRPGMPLIEQRVDLADGRVEAFTLIQRPARALSGNGPWPMRLTLFAGSEKGEPLRIPLTISGDSTPVPELAGRPAPPWAFANGLDQAYALVLLDPGSVAFLERGIGSIGDSFLRAMLWSALWDMVREARLSPARYIGAALRELPRETDEQILASLLSRVTRAASAYLTPVQRDALVPDIERALLAGVAAPGPYGPRKASLDAFIRVAATPPAVAALDAFLDSTSVAGDSLRPATRWAVVTRLVATAAPGASRRLAAETARDASAEGMRRAFVAGAARPDPAVKQEYFSRYFADAGLNEDWATASLEAFNVPEQQSITRAFLFAALDSIVWIQRNRRIFYLGSWLGAFMEGQTSAEALGVVRAFLARRGDIGADLRLKVLQAMDELLRTARIRSAFGLDDGAGTPTVRERR